MTRKQGLSTDMSDNSMDLLTHPWALKNSSTLSQGLKPDMCDRLGISIYMMPMTDEVPSLCTMKTLVTVTLSPKPQSHPGPS